MREVRILAFASREVTFSLCNKVIFVWRKGLIASPSQKGEHDYISSNGFETAHVA